MGTHVFLYDIEGSDQYGPLRTHEYRLPIYKGAQHDFNHFNLMK